MSYTCIFCDKIFVNKYNLTNHQKTVKRCLEIQERKKINESDKKKDEKEMFILNCKVKMLEKIIQEKDELIAELLKQPKNTTIKIGNTTNNNNQILNLTSLKMTQEAFQERIQKTLTEEHLNLPTADYVSKNLIRDDEGNLMYKITDIARNKFQYNSEGNCETDLNAAKLIEAIGKPLKEETHIKIIEMIEKNNMSAEQISKQLLKEREFTNLDNQFIKQLAEKTV
tara:strand:+ start:54 stop:731 length:678 start_codon:yes stop_codon:yes gene_type:complete